MSRDTAAYRSRVAAHPAFCELGICDAGDEPAGELRLKGHRKLHIR
ncbi:hypothetical protein [Leifsonia sp. Leaf264]|nr:hypothetical protein [Leifsonia sp. Leaf264]